MANPVPLPPTQGRQVSVATCRCALRVRPGRPSASYRHRGLHEPATPSETRRMKASCAHQQAGVTSAQGHQCIPAAAHPQVFVEPLRAAAGQHRDLQLYSTSTHACTHRVRLRQPTGGIAAYRINFQTPLVRGHWQLEPRRAGSTRLMHTDPTPNRSALPLTLAARPLSTWILSVTPLFYNITVVWPSTACIHLPTPAGCGCAGVPHSLTQ